jgi:hypothetical protein
MISNATHEWNLKKTILIALHDLLESVLSTIEIRFRKTPKLQYTLKHRYLSNCSVEAIFIAPTDNSEFCNVGDSISISDQALGF